MDCLFCDTPCQSDNNLDSWVCNFCNLCHQKYDVLVQYFPKDSISTNKYMIIYSFIYNDKLFYIDYNLLYKKYTLFINGLKHCEFLGDLMDITPANINDKISLLVNFA